MRFAALLWSVFQGPCRDLNELRHLAALLFDKYTAPIRSGLMHSLWTIIVDDLVKSTMFQHFLVYSHRLFAVFQRGFVHIDILGAIAADNNAALYKAITPHFKTQLRRIYLRETSTAEWDRIQSEVGDVILREYPHHGTLCKQTSVPSHH